MPPQPKEVNREYKRAWRQANPAREKLNQHKSNIGRRTYHRDWKRKNKDKVRDYKYQVLYGITEAQYQKMFAMQFGVCAICNRPPKVRRLAVDHDHKTNRVRCLVCWQCNQHKIGNNTVDTARKVLAILESDFDGRTL